MATLEELQARLDDLREARATPESEARFGEDFVKMRPDHELRSAIADLEKQIAAIGRKPVRRILVGTTKGF